MSNYNIEIDLLKLKGAKVADVQGKTQTKKCVCVPIDNSTGTVTDAYITRDQETGKRVEVKKKGVRLNLIAYEMQRKERGQSHLVKPSLSKEAMEQLPETFGPEHLYHCVCEGYGHDLDTALRLLYTGLPLVFGGRA